MPVTSAGYFHSTDNLPYPEMKFLIHLFLFSCLPSYLCGQVSLEAHPIRAAEVYFDFGKATIRPEAESKIINLIEAAAQEQRVFIRITAHTDSIGSVVNNLKLSRKRAEVIRTRLLASEIKADSISIELFGESNPAAPNTTDLGRQQNRRATVEVLSFREMITLTGAVLEQDSEQGISATVTIRSKDDNQTLYTDEDGRFQSKVPLGAVIGIDVTAKGYFLASKMLKATPEALRDEFQIQLPRLEKGKAADIDNLYFVSGRDILLESSEPELPKVLKFMQLNDKIKIEIAGHVNVPNQGRIPRSSNHFLLSVMRALVVYNYLLRNGIAEERVSYQGYGNWEMRFPNAQTESQQSANRRVEIKILETEMSTPANNSPSKADTTTGSY
ncbi:hypothetical protein CEQ90_04745 [Lewinellaceae bacterium SD302]|nr:hypothetical protein CEQ90_04745 [Lewinellaceae bacterium SD302]